MIFSLFSILRAKTYKNKVWDGNIKCKNKKDQTIDKLKL
jgi:hypothetical protein